MDIGFVWEGLERVRVCGPLVLSVTNYVAANLNANGLLAVGASPVMTHQAAEIEDLTAISGAVVCNMGVPAGGLPEAIYTAAECSRRLSKPLIFDPVGAGASGYRNRVCEKLFQAASPDVIRGNGSEIIALAGQSGATKGVESTQGALEARSEARGLAERYGCVVCVSGEVDLVTDGKREIMISNGNAMMPLITGLGCTATALVGAFCAVAEDTAEAVAAAMTVLAVAGEMAADHAAGPATLQIGIIDALYVMTEKDVRTRARISA